MKKKVVCIGASASINRCLYETNDDIRNQVEREIGFRLGECIVENKDESPIKFRKFVSEYDVQLLGEVLLVDSELRHVVELIVGDGDLSEIMYRIQEYRARQV